LCKYIYFLLFNKIWVDDFPDEWNSLSIAFHNLRKGESFRL